MLDVEGTMIIHTLQSFQREMLAEKGAEQKAMVGMVHARYEIDTIIDYIRRIGEDHGQATSTTA